MTQTEHIGDAPTSTGETLRERAELVYQLLGEVYGIKPWKPRREPLHEIELVGGGDAPPSLRLVGAAAACAAERGVGGWLVSVSHDGGIAAAVCVALAR